jgi:hypothetical protein
MRTAEVLVEKAGVGAVFLQRRGVPHRAEGTARRGSAYIAGRLDTRGRGHTVSKLRAVLLPGLRTLGRGCLGSQGFQPVPGVLSAGVRGHFREYVLGNGNGSPNTKMTHIKGISALFAHI